MEFTYTPLDSGVVASVGDDAGSARLTASHVLSDPLAALLDALWRLVDWTVLAPATHGEYKWDEEPGQFRWIFSRDQGQLANAQILWFENPHDRSYLSGDLVFATEQPLAAGG